MTGSSGDRMPEWRMCTVRDGHERDPRPLVGCFPASAVGLAVPAALAAAAAQLDDRLTDGFDPLGLLHRQQRRPRRCAPSRSSPSTQVFGAYVVVQQPLSASSAGACLLAHARRTALNGMSSDSGDFFTASETTDDVAAKVVEGDTGSRARIRQPRPAASESSTPRRSRARARWRSTRNWLTWGAKGRTARPDARAGEND